MADPVVIQVNTEPTTVIVRRPEVTEVKVKTPGPQGAPGTLDGVVFDIVAPQEGETLVFETSGSAFRNRTPTVDGGFF